MKEKGILLSIFSLPSKYGIGDFGNEAFEFVDILNKNNMNYWQILPINASKILPYSPISYYALNEDYISLDKLQEMGLIGKIEIRPNYDRVIYDDFKKKYYEEAFKNFKPNKQYEMFIKIKEIKEYAEYINIKTGESKEYHLFLQYIAYKQWMDLKQYANSKNIKIIGDMPVYPTFESAETMFNPLCFEMENGKFTFESGTPPDYFNSDGQKWGNPVYDVEYLKQENYEYLTRRFKYHLDIFDKIRVDYFRGYDSFFKIPIGKTGKEGSYSDGVSYGFFDELFKDNKVKVEDLIVEDLGDIREETVALRENYGFTRQKILQFTLDLKNIVDNDNVDENVMMFPGNHDCQTLYGWYKSLKLSSKIGLIKFLKKNKCCYTNINKGLLQYSKKCKAKIVIVSVQDILGLDDKARMNFPGTQSDKNWSWKLKDFIEFKEKIKDF